MAKVTAPLLSFSASGAIAKTQVYSRWRGIPYVRQHVIPSNPQTADQSKTRNVFSWVNGVFKLMSTDAQAPWVGYSKGKPLTSRNACLKFNVAALRSATESDDFVASPGSGGGQALASASAANSAGTVTVTATVPTLPAGWTVTNVTAMLMPQVNPQTDTAYITMTETDEATPFAPAFTDVAAGTYDWLAWAVYLKPDGSTAYGPSSSGTVTVS